MVWKKKQKQWHYLLLFKSLLTTANVKITVLSLKSTWKSINTKFGTQSKIPKSSYQTRRGLRTQLKKFPDASCDRKNVFKDNYGKKYLIKTLDFM